MPTDDHELPVLGLFPGTLNQVEVTIFGPDSLYAIDTLEIQTDPLPDYLPEIEIRSINESAMEPGWNLSSLSLGDNGVFSSQPIMFDPEGNIRWFMNLSFTNGLVFVVKRLQNGNMLFAYANVVYEYDMLGEEINRWQMNGFNSHHEVVEKPDGNFLVAVDNVNIGTIEDHIVELDRNSGSVVRVWDLREVLDVDRYDVFGFATDWLHVNSVWYDESDGGLIISGRNQGVFKVSADNQLVWILAPHRGWGKAGIDGNGFETSDFLLTALDENGTPYAGDIQEGITDTPEFDWSWGQHAAMILPNRNIFIFDNGLNRFYSNSSPDYSRGVEYEVNTQDMTVKQVWQYGKERGEDFYGHIISDVDYLPQTGNRLIMPGVSFDSNPRAFVTEVSYSGREVVYEAAILFRNQLSGGTGAWGDYDLVYRSHRMSLYPD